jgi:hypothetical protein
MCSEFTENKKKLEYAKAKREKTERGPKKSSTNG